MLTDPVVFYKSLADATRLRSLLLIHQYQELCVCELMQALQESQPKVSRHLAQLKDAEILLDRRQGKWIYYRIHPDLPAWAFQVLAHTLQANPQFLQSNTRLLQEMGARPERQQVCCEA